MNCIPLQYCSFNAYLSHGVVLCIGLKADIIGELLESFFSKLVK